MAVDASLRPQRLDILLNRAAIAVALPFAAFAIFVSLPNLFGWQPPSVSEELLKPLALVCLLTAVVISSSRALEYARLKPERVWIGIVLDVIAIAAIWAFAFTYLHEMIIEKPEIFPEWMHIDADPMERVLSGPPQWTIVVAVAAVIVLMYLNYSAWGAPLVLVALAAAAYAVFCAVSSAMGWSPTNVFLNYAMGANDPMGELRKYLIVGDAHSLLGQFPSLLLRVVLPFILLGNVFAGTGGGRSLIKLAFQLTRKTRGGPAHAAIVSSSLFGTISGGPVINVLSTGVLTIPMMTERGFRPRFAGAVEASASSGGQVMPPVMGVAAFFLASFTGVPYNQVAIAALVPALFFYFCLFISVSIEARKQNIKPVGELSTEFRMTRQDWANLSIVILPVLVIVACLISQRFTITAAGIFALLLLLPLTFIDAEIRKAPMQLLLALGRGAVAAGKILLLFTAVAVVDSSLSAVGFPNAVANLFSRATDTTIFAALPFSQTFYLLFVLLITMGATLLLGMGMPTLPAYANVAIIMTGGLANLGISYFAANMFVFYFAVASAITPPVAVAAFAAASVTRADPVATAVASVRLGAMMFLVPFVFVFYPELLFIAPAFQADMITGELIAMRPDGFLWQNYVSIVLRLVLIIYLVATALGRFDHMRLSGAQSALRLILSLAILIDNPLVYVPATLAALVVLAMHFIAARSTALWPAQDGLSGG